MPDWLGGIDDPENSIIMWLTAFFVTVAATWSKAVTRHLALVDVLVVVAAEALTDRAEPSARSRALAYQAAEQKGEQQNCRNKYAR